jgi:SAM-dependent methyltransferase
VTATGSHESRLAVRSFYDEFSLEAGLRDWRRPNGRHERLRLELDDLLGGARGLRILDLGCGGGVMASHLCRYGEVTGIDLSRSAIELARLLEPRARFEAGTIEEHERERTYDLVTLFDVVEHVPASQRPSLFGEIGRVLAPGGWVVLSTPHPDYTRWVRKKRPELLQVVDEPVELAELIRLGGRIGLEPIAYRTYQIDAPGSRQYQLAGLAPVAGAARELYRSSPGHRVRVRLASDSNPVAPPVRRALHAARLARAGRPRAAAWILGLRPEPPVRAGGP